MRVNRNGRWTIDASELIVSISDNERVFLKPLKERGGRSLNESEWVAKLSNAMKIKEMETRHVIVEKDFVKIRNNRFGGELPNYLLPKNV